jgi:hypothetical protein
LLLLRGDRGDLLGLFVGLLHHVGVQDEQLTLTAQSRWVCGAGEASASRLRSSKMALRKVVRASGGSLSGHKNTASLLRGCIPPFDCQVEQQGLRLAQGKREAAAVMKYFGIARYSKT